MWYKAKDKQVVTQQVSLKVTNSLSYYKAIDTSIQSI